MAQVDLPDLKQLEADGKEALEVVHQYVCKTEQDYVSCTQFFKWVKARKKEIKAELDKNLEPKIKLLDQMHTDACALRKKIFDPFDKAEVWIENVMRPWAIEQKRKSDEEKKGLQDIADKAAADEKELLQLQAEIEGRPEEAAIIEQLPAVAASVKMAPDLPKQADMSVRQKWNWVRVDESLIPDMYWMLDEKAITQMVNKWGDKSNIPGIKVTPDVGFAG